MCGIAGWIDRERDLTGTRSAVTAMARTLACRGPDAESFWFSPQAALAHRRLIVIDPEGGGQPMASRERGRTCVLNYNGELYNTPELRRDLAARGYRFHTRSDSEVLLNAFLEWGPACAQRLNGIFAFAVWDQDRRQLFLARDRLGVKPLFYAQRGSAFLFASEIKALLAHPLVEPEVDAGGLAEVFVLGPARTPGHGVFRGITELKPGHCLTVDTQGTRIRRYWTLESRPHEDDPATTAETVRELLRDAVRRQMVSDVPICALLSGGLDSSALTAFAVEAGRQYDRETVHTWSVDYRGNDRHFRPSDFQPNADGPWVRLVSKHFGTMHHNVVIDTADLVEALIPAMRARDLPGMADVDASLLVFCREIKRGATVALSGECADEVFGGYPWFHRREALEAETFPWSLSLTFREEVMSGELRAVTAPREYLARRYQEALAEVPRLPGEDTEHARMRELFYLNLFRWMPTLLDRKDRMSMAAGLEVRVPYCDHRLVEYLWNIPWSVKTPGGVPKGLLRRALQGILPAAVLNRRKSPYPKTHNPAYLETVQERVRDTLADPTSPLLPLIDRAVVTRLADGEADRLSRPWFGQLMAGPQLLAYLIQVDAWLREYRVRLV